MVHLVGLDGATDDGKIGLAFGVFDGGELQVSSAQLCTRRKAASATIAEWLAGVPSPSLLAIDAPLGWPAALSAALSRHQAGQEIVVEPHMMFRRETDRFLQRELRKTPLDVGADRIARTAHAALRILGELRRRLAAPIPLAWSADIVGLQAIEVYPAATLLSHGLRSTGYKGSAQSAEREEIIKGLGKRAALPGDRSSMRASSDALDAVVCLLAAADFLNGYAVPPKDLTLAQREGWIWARPR